MDSIELVKKTILGRNETGATPIYGWVKDTLSVPICEKYGTVSAFEDEYGFDLAHIFCGLYAYDTPEINKLRAGGARLTPGMLLELGFKDPNMDEDYRGIREELAFYREGRGRFCYMQTWGPFETMNGVFGMENHLMHMVEYPEEMARMYKRVTAWNLQFINNVIDLGIDMIHISDDWGAQNSLIFSPDSWRRMIYPEHREMVRSAHERGALASLHSDGNVTGVLDGVAEIGYDCVHPYQESAGMKYQTYLDKYRDRFALMGGLCVQSVIGFGDHSRLENEIKRVFSILKNKRWVFCTTHYVQPHCSLDELELAFSLARELSK